MKTDLLREKYLLFFKKNGHRIITSSALVPENDPTLLFTSAGMNQFKEQFKGSVGDYRRAATCQKCLRTDDLEKVGQTPAHHTFFEMLGNFSFGDYFKKEAVLWAWEFLIKELKIPEQKLRVSVYKDDDEAYDIWQRLIKMPKERIVKLGEIENFWPSDAIKHGPNGPCGPCSEIFFDRGENTGCRKRDCSPACGCGRFIEIWNLVFTQFERIEGGILKPLPNKNIDTGMGLERMASVLQGVNTNFEIDILKPLVDFICRETKTDYKTDPHVRRDVFSICDHIRAVTFAVCENILPSNEERGYVIRKLIRKACMHLRSLAQKQEPFLHRLVPITAESMKAQYPELEKRQKTIGQIIMAEEERFQQVLQSAENLIESKFSALNGLDTGKIAFELYDTSGLPLEITKDLAKKKFNLDIDEKSFSEHMSRQKNRSKVSSQMQGEVFAGGLSAVLQGIKKTEFLGYEQCLSEGKVVMVLQDTLRRNTAEKGQKVSLVLNKTPFYGEKGGQAADTGIIETSNFRFKVAAARTFNDIILHDGVVEEGEISEGKTVLAKIDQKRRSAITKHHTATHLLQSALREVLGGHVEQSGSFVDAKRLRFDFTHFQAVDKKQLARVEKLVNEYIQGAFTVQTKILNKKDALRLGALAFFGEKYDEEVRVVVIDNVSQELCGGTHINSTSEAEVFKIVKESSVSSGIRRIEAVCGEAARDLINEEKRQLMEISHEFNTDINDIPLEILKKDTRLKILKNKLAESRNRIVSQKIEEIIKKARKDFGTSIIILEFSDLGIDSLRSMSDNIAQKLKSYVVILFAKKYEDSRLALEQKVSVVVSVSKDNIAKGLEAGSLIKEIVKKMGGSGGGRADFAQAGAKEVDKLDETIKAIPEIVGGFLK